MVEHALAGDVAALKERVIGVEVFGRQLEYDTSTDSVVRVRANELRKRLAQYYERHAAADMVRIELPPGSYVPQFSWLSPAAPAGEGSEVPGTPPSSAGSSRPGNGSHRWLLGGLFLAATFVTAFLAMRPHLVPEIDRFWEPVLEAEQPIVCMPGRERLFLDDRIRRELLDSAEDPARPIVLKLNKDDVVAVPQGQMSVQNVRALLSISRFFAERGKPVEFRLVSEVAFADITQRAVILVGAYHNPWAEQLSRNLRFGFESRGTGSREVCWVRDRREVGEPQWVVPKLWPYAPQGVDYAVVTRVLDRSTGRVVVSFAGVNGFGTQAAAEFLTVPRYWREVARQAPRGWHHHNCQIVLKTEVVGLVPNPPRVVAVEVW